MSSDPLLPLLDLAGVADGFAEARAAVDEALRHRALRRHGGPLAAEASLVAARASAALEGHDHALEDIRGGTVTDPVVQGALRVAEAVPGMVEQWRRAPLQVLARLHVLAARGSAPDETLGRPAGSALPPAEVSARLDALAHLVAGTRDADGGAGGRLEHARPNAGPRDGEAPALLLAAVVHGELLAVRPFQAGNGVVARAAARITLAERGLDPRAVIVPEVGHLARQPEYVGASGAYATGTPDGMRSWLRHYATAVTLGAAETTSIATRLLPS